MVSKSPTVTSHSWVPSMPSWSIRLIDSVAPACVWRSRIHVDASPGTMSYTYRRWSVRGGTTVARLFRRSVTFFRSTPKAFASYSIGT
ncbi:hypothetical protein ACQPZU_07320 [Saccharomonospora azurea]|uniref:hypothetical protein n=1 Tax=Saccharomonospora azurea TaxID=40988 RepID=UPI00332CE748